MRINKKKLNIESNLILLCVYLSYTTYITQYFFGISEYIAEGLPLLLGFAGLSIITGVYLLNYKIKDNSIILLISVYLTYVFSKN